MKSPLDLQPTLTGTLIQLRPLKDTDFESLYQAASDPLIWELHPEPTRYQREVFSNYFSSAMDSKGAFVILDQKTGEIMGSSRYYDYQPDRSEVSVGFTFLTRKYWGGVYNRELKKLMLTHAFQKLDQVVFHVGKNNFRSQAAMKKIGGILDGMHDSNTVNFKITKTNFKL